MLTIFSTAKPFSGRNGIIQRNALTSWKLLHPDVDVILFGDELGATEVCTDLSIRHEPEVRRNQNGTKYLNYIFDRAYECSHHRILCYANCDIMLGSDFPAALELVAKSHDRFLMIGRRWDTNIAEPWDFTQPAWQSRLRSHALVEGRRNGASWIDYFCFSRDLYFRQMPPFLIGRQGWDPWLTYFARKCRVPVIDASRMVVAVHQNHDYSYLQLVGSMASSAAEVRYNLSLGGTSSWRFYSAYAATESLVDGRLTHNWFSWCGPILARSNYLVHQIWFGLLGLTRPIRHWLGLRKSISR